jgi:hypothetical protein
MHKIVFENPKGRDDLGHFHVNKKLLLLLLLLLLFYSSMRGTR